MTTRRRRLLGAISLAVTIAAAATVGATFTALCGNGTSCAYNGTEPRPGYQTFEKIRANFNDHETRILAVEGTFKRATVTLTNAQIKALPTTPIAIVAAPGAGKRIVWQTIDVAVNPVAGAYTNIDAGGYLVALMSSDEVSNFAPNDAGESLTRLSDLLTAGNRTYAQLIPWTATSAGWSQLPSVWNADGHTNVPLQLSIENGGSGVLTGGNAANTMTVTVTYYVVTVV